MRTRIARPAVVTLAVALVAAAPVWAQGRGGQRGAPGGGGRTGSVAVARGGQAPRMGSYAGPRSGGSRSYASPSPSSGGYARGRYTGTGGGSRAYGPPPGAGSGGGRYVAGNGSGRSYGPPPAGSYGGGRYTGGSRAYGPPPGAGGRPGHVGGGRPSYPYRAPPNGAYYGGRPAYPRPYYGGYHGYRGPYYGRGYGAYYPPYYRPYYGGYYGPRYGGYYPTPYYTFRPWFSVGFGISVGYPVAFPVGFTVGTGYGVPYGYSTAVGVAPGASAYGGVSFDIDPPYASIMIDGTYVGDAGSFGPTAQPLTLVAGRHRVEVRADGFQPVVFDLDVLPGQVIPYRGAMVPY